MKILAYLRGLGAKFFRKDELAEEMEEELRSHIEHRADDLERSGMGRAEAERRARIEFGATRAIQGRKLRRRWAGIFYWFRVGFSVCGKGSAQVSGLRVRRGYHAGAGDRRQRRGVQHFECVCPAAAECARCGKPVRIAAWRRGIGEPVVSQLSRSARPQSHLRRASSRRTSTPSGWTRAKIRPARGSYEASGNYFDGLGLQPYLGHFFHASDEHGPNSAPYIVLGYAFWHTHFQDDRSVVGRVVQLDRHPFTIIGVAPPGFRGTLLFFDPDFYVPIVNHQQLWDR